MTRDFPYNPVLSGISYKNEVMTLFFKNGVKRQYFEVPKQIVCGLFYKSTGTEVVKYFNQNIKKQFKTKTT